MALTVKEVAKMLRLNPDLVRKKAARGLIYGKKVPGGKKWLFSEEEIKKILP